MNHYKFFCLVTEKGERNGEWRRDFDPILNFREWRRKWRKVGPKKGSPPHLSQLSILQGG